MRTPTLLCDGKELGLDDKDMRQRKAVSLQRTRWQSLASHI